ncbi:MAG: hypothetical protein RR528_08900 [Angelakisella sp.]
MDILLGTGMEIKYWRVYGPTGTLPPGMDANSDVFVTVRSVDDEWGRQTIEDVRSSTTYQRWYHPVNGIFTFGSWEKVATATPPQEFDLPLISGVTKANTWDACSYSKDQFERVDIHFNVSLDNTVTGDQNMYTVAMLPAGFRPKLTVMGVSSTNADNVFLPYWISSIGQFVIYATSGKPQAVAGSISFVAVAK